MNKQDFVCIIDELIENAFKFSESDTFVKVCSQIRNRVFHLTISDRGRGMTDRQIAKIGLFAQFERKYYEQQGVSLGLKIVKKIVEIHRGEFSISSAYLQGTTVYIALPSI